MARIFHLSHLLDKDGYKRIDLISFYELSKLDDYLEKFTSNKDVRKKYEMDISEFCLDNRKMIEEENKKNHHNWTGSIAIICEERDSKDKPGLIHKIPIIYQNNPKLFSKDECLKKIKEKLKKLSTICYIYLDKNYMLSQNERELVLLYKKTHNKKYLRSASDFFYNRIKTLDDELLYYYCRTLMHIFELNKLEVKTKFGNIENINLNIPSDTVLERYNAYSNDAYFNKLVSDENYEELFNNYDLDEININSDMFEKGMKK